MKMLATLRGGDPKIVETLADAKKAKGLLVRVLSEHPPVLSEDAWDAILAEHDVEVLAWWIALVSLSARELHQSQVRRALFENAELRRYAMTIGRDEGEMREIEALIEKARTHKQ